jgi:signal transduction histidine kinase
VSPDPLTVSPPAIPDASLGGVDDRLWVALERAASRVTAEWRLLADDAVSAEEAGAGLAHLLGGMMRLAMNQEPDVEALPRSVLGRRLLAVLRRQFVKEAQALEQTPDAGQLLTVFACFERLYTYLESDWSKRFAERMAGAGGLELVVEVAHDFRSPLTSILFLAETLKKGRSGPVTPVQERQLGLIYSAAFGLSGVASDVIELARGGDRLVELDPIPFSIDDIFESVRDITQPIAEEKGLEIRLVPPTGENRVGHPVALSRVLLNLSTNALKFTDEGAVEVGGRCLEGGKIHFWVQDSGRGIAAGAMNTLYEPFRRRQRAGEYAFSGSGLGLSICRKLVEAMGGELQVDTEEGKGTKFSFVVELPTSAR